jgi:hypothetical protein
MLTEIVNFNEKQLSQNTTQIMDVLLKLSKTERSSVWLSEKAIFLDNSTGKIRVGNYGVLNLLKKWAGRKTQKSHETNLATLGGLLEKYSTRIEISEEMKDFIQW